jgi:nickel-dependent lactate racemase
MSEVLQLRYGKGVLRSPFPEGSCDVIEARMPECEADPVGLLESALASPVGSPSFEALFESRDSVGIIVPDLTRYSGVEHLLPVLLDRLNACGIKDSQIEVIFALGIHRSQTREEQCQIVGRDVAARISLVDHSAEQSCCQHRGTTSRGTPVEINSRALSKSKLILIGAITFHYFAGFGGGRKLLLPGIASSRSCAANHLLVLTGRGRHPGIGPGRLDQNPVHLDMLEACEMVRPKLLINTVLNPERKIIQVIAGDYRDSHMCACRYYASLFTAPVEKPYDVVIVSAGGYPSDINLIQAHKAIDMAFHATRPGGTIVAVAECGEGFGHQDFFRWFAHRDLKTLEHHLRTSYHIYGQTAHALLWKANDVRAMRIQPISSLDEAVEFISNKYGRTSPSICVLPHGATILPVVKSQ